MKSLIKFFFFQPRAKDKRDKISLMENDTEHVKAFT